MFIKNSELTYKDLNIINTKRQFVQEAFRGPLYKEAFHIIDIDDSMISYMQIGKRTGLSVPLWWFMHHYLSHIVVVDNIEELRDIVDSDYKVDR